MPRHHLPQGSIKAIHSAIDNLFDRAKVRVLGPQSVDKRLGISATIFNPTFSIPGIFTAASREEYIKSPDEAILKVLLGNVSNYIESYRAATKAKVTHAVDAFLQEAALSGVKTDLETVLGGQLTEVWGQVTRDMKRLIDTECNNSKNTGVLDGIIRVNAAHDIEDPAVYFATVRDSKRCEECTRIHMLEDGITPRLWYLSEVGHSYHKKGEDSPALGGLHPNCRCTIVTVMPGYGFDAAGMITFKGIGFAAIGEQRGTKG